MRKLTHLFVAVFSFILALALVPGLKAKAFETETYYVNSETGYKVLIHDGAGLFTQEELNKLAYEDMYPLTQYCDCILYTTDVNPYSATESEPMAKAMLDTYPTQVTCFLIDMATRDLRLQSAPLSQDRISVSKAESIMDNVFRYAGNGEWYECAHNTFDQAYRVSAGKRISQPMRYICAAFLAVAVALLGNFIVLRISTTNWDTDTADLLKNVKDANFDAPGLRADLTRTKKVYSPPSSSSSGGGGGHSGGGGGGHSGGGSSGGSHHF